MELVNLNDIPPEVLPNIFKFLPLEARKNVRLTSHLWNSACHYSEISIHEKLVFHPSDIATEEDVEILSNIIYSRKNFRPKVIFKWIDIGLLPSLLWERFGSHLESLTFLYCYNFTAETLRNIIVHCSRLNYLQLFTDEEGIQIDSLFSNKIIDELIDFQVTREKLTVFMFTSSSTSIPDDETYRRIFQIFPNLSVLNVDNFSTMLTKCILGEKFTSPFSPEKQNLITVLHERYLWTVPLSKNSEIKFVVFRAHFDIGGGLTVRSIKNFVLRQPELKVLELVLSGKHEGVEAKSLLSAILRNSSMVALEFNSVPIIFNHAELKDFLQAIRSFTHLNLSYFRVNNIDPSELLFSEINYPKMRGLQFLGCTEEFYLMLLDRCVGLTHLTIKLSRISGKTLQNIFENHTKLESLQLNGFNNETQTSRSFAPNYFDLSEDERKKPRFHQCHGLRILEIICGSFMYLNMDDVLYSVPGVIALFELSNLTHFQFTFTVPSIEWNLPEFLEMMAVKAPLLKRLYITTDNIVNTWSSDDCFTHLKKFKKLKSLDFPLLHLGYPMTELSLKSETSILRDLFIECSRLKIVYIANLGYFFCNRVSEQIVFRK